MRNISGMVYIYCWHEARFHAIKVGFGTDPLQRMNDYCREYNMRVTPHSLQSVKIPDNIDTQALEQEGS